MRKAIEHPGLDADVNIVGTITVLEAARAVGARVLFALTGGAAYGEYDGLPIPSPETAETRPLSHYGMSKMTGEGYLRLYYRLYGIETVALRLANVYGPRQEPHGEAGVVAIFCGLLLKGGSPKSSAMAIRRGTTSTWVTSSRPSWPQRQGRLARR